MQIQEFLYYVVQTIHQCHDPFHLEMSEGPGGTQGEEVNKYQ